MIRGIYIETVDTGNSGESPFGVPKVQGGFTPPKLSGKRTERKVLFSHISMSILFGAAILAAFLFYLFSFSATSLIITLINNSLYRGEYIT